MKKEQTYIDAGGDVLQTPIRNNDSCCDLTSMQLKKKEKLPTVIGLAYITYIVKTFTMGLSLSLQT